jgi:hypothetical protein
MSQLSVWNATRPAPDGMAVMHERVTQLERENAELRAQLRDREEELQWLMN